MATVQDYYVLQKGKQVNIIPFKKEHFVYFNEKLSDQLVINVDVLTCSSFGLLQPLKEVFDIQYDLWGGEFNLEKFIKDETLDFNEYKTAPSITIPVSQNSPNYLLCRIITEDADSVYTIPLSDPETFNLLKAQVETGKFEIYEFYSDKNSVNTISRLHCELLLIFSIIHLQNFNCKKWKDDDMPERFKVLIDTILLTEFDEPDNSQDEEIEEIEEKLDRLGFILGYKDFI